MRSLMTLGLLAAAITLTSAVTTAQKATIPTVDQLGCNEGTQVKDKAPKTMPYNTQLWVREGCGPGYARCVHAAAEYKGKRPASVCVELPK